MLNFPYIYCDAYNEITANRDMKMRDYELSDEEWEIVKQLSSVLKIFKDATLFFPDSSNRVTQRSQYLQSTETL